MIIPILGGIIFVLLSCAIAGYLHMRRKQWRIQGTLDEYNEAMMTLMVERDRQLSLMSTIDEATSALLSIPDGEDEQFTASLRSGIATIAACVQVGRVRVWRNETVDGKSSYRSRMAWDNHAAEVLSYDRKTRFYYEQTPGWEEKLRYGDIINISIEDMSDEEKAVMGTELQAVLIMPVHMQEQFWGTVTFGDYDEARHFTADQINLARSAAMMIVSAYNKQRQAARIREANSRIKKLLDTTPVCCFIWNQQGIIIDCNEAALVFFEAKDITEMQQKYHAYFPKEQPDGNISEQIATHYIQRAFTEEYLKVDWTYQNPETGEFIPTEAILVRVDYEDGEQVVAEYALDMRTHMRMLSEIERRGKQLEEALETARFASRAKGDFLSNMSHEIRTPMNAIIGMTTIGRQAESMERKDYSFGRIEAASNHLLGIINDVLDMSKIEAGKMTLSPQPFELSRLFWLVDNVISFKLDEKKQKYVTDIDPDIPPVLVGDDQRLKQVLTNLISNAVKFTPENKTISMEAKLVHKNGENIEVQFNIIDEGIGISPEQQSRLFQSFNQAEASTTRRYGGTGLGLSISKQIVELMGGKIWVESELGKGARFCFTVQLITSEQVLSDKAEEDDDNEFPDFTGKTLLMAEDIDINQEIIITMLEPTGITIECANNGDEALRHFETQPEKYDLIFMDIHMPVLDGYDATRQIRALPNPKAQSIPIIAMTANVFQEDVERCLAAGMNAHLGKPLNFSDMMATLKRFLS